MSAIAKIDASPLTTLARVLAGWLIPRTPAWVTPNQITLLAFGCYVASGFAFYLASFQPLWLFAAIVGLILHWVCDNLDGELARARGMTSERGFYLDLLLDQFGITAVAVGAACASYANATVILAGVLAYQLMVHVTLLQIIMRRRFDLGRLGPAEGRLGLILLALITFFWPGPVLTIAGAPLGWVDLGVSAMMLAVVIEKLTAAARLYAELEPPRANGKLS